MTGIPLGPFPADSAYADARALDAADPLYRFHNEFLLADPGLIHLDGNSLGRSPKTTVDRVRDVVEDEWGTNLIRSWPTRHP